MLRKLNRSKAQNFTIMYPELGEKSQLVTFKTTRTKNIRISLKSTLQIVVTMPGQSQLKFAKKFFESKIIWVKNSLDLLEKKQEIRKRNSTPKKTLSEDEFSAKGRHILLRCQELAQKHSFKIGKVTLRRQKTIWGSCSSQNNISLNANLALLSDHLIDYVILHELTHTKVKNHSRKFWHELEKLIPNCKELDRQLKRSSPACN